MNHFRIQYRTPQWPSEIVWRTVRTARDQTDTYLLASAVWNQLGIHDRTTPVEDLLRLAVWAVANGAPADLVDFGEKGNDGQV
ncbi:hypothetical protein [Microbacterium caowuchunii]|uniref:Uncharacterized protein n=1 Tax=Microbacterium caowuchunii TaxID=2614638 RepID=A0A5N0T8A0_9MICO|nr:hypothetical protein [Microbacterium caowuchunii]KAA9131160.1 hypothetical protein F6B40_12735 [Microbacterium caowuchunii]